MPIITGNLDDLVSAPVSGALLSFTSNTRATDTYLALANPVTVVSGANGHFVTPNLLFGVYSLTIRWAKSSDYVAGKLVETYARSINLALTIPNVAGPLDIIPLLNLTSPPPPTAGYSKTQIDALLAALVAGGSGAPSGVPLETRLYWDRTNLVLYIGDNGSWTQLLAL